MVQETPAYLAGSGSTSQPTAPKQLGTLLTRTEELVKLLKLPWPVRAFGSIPCHCRHCLEAVWCEAVYQEVGVEEARVWDLGKLKQRQTLYPPRRTSMALSHQFIWSSTNLMLCFMRSGGSSLAWPTTARNTKQEAEDTVRNCVRGSSSRVLLSPYSRSTAAGAAVPMPRFWIWYTGCVGLCPSFSPLGGTGATGGGGAVPSGVEAFVAAAGPFPSSRGFMRTMGFSRGAGAGGAAGAAGGGGCFDYGSEKVPVRKREIHALTAPSLPF